MNSISKIVKIASITISILGALLLVVSQSKFHFSKKTEFIFICCFLGGMGGFLAAVYGRIIVTRLTAPLGAIGLVGGGFAWFLSAPDTSFYELAKYAFQGGGALLVISIPLWLIGDPGELQQQDIMDSENMRMRHSNVFCAGCGQHLGVGAAFQSPCPRCGSNRHTFDASM